MGHSVTILTGDRYFPFPNYDETVGKLIGDRYQQPGEKKMNGMLVIRKKIVAEFAARALFFGVRETITDVKPDLILVSGMSTPAAVQAAFFKPKDCRLILVDSHLPSELNNGNQLFKYFFYGSFRVLFASLISKKADKLIAVQEATVDVINTTYGIKKKPVIISHGTDSVLFTSNKQSGSAIRKKHSIPQKTFVVITSGKIIPAKGVDLLFQAIAILFKKDLNIHLIVVGDGPKEYKETCLNFIQKKDMNRIHILGFQPQADLPKYYSAADIAVWPLQESLAMNDAISCSLPVIVNDKIGVKERFSNKNGVFYKQGDVADLAKKIENLYLDPEKRKKMGERGRQLVEMKMSWSQKAREYINL